MGRLSRSPKREDSDLRSWKLRNCAAMRNIFLLLISAVVVSAAVPVGGYPDDREADRDVTRYLPGEDAIVGWSASGDPQVAGGEDLYLLIDGGAEIFTEYGFERAVMQSYESASGEAINLEIYEMDNPFSAYGIYSFRRGEGGEEIAVGDEGSLEDYYLNFWKGRVLVTVIGFDTDSETLGGVEAIARAVAARIEDGGQKPPLIKLLPPDGLKPQSIKYLEGNLALYNSYELDRKNIFGMSEGVIGAYDGYKILLLAYKNEVESGKWFLSGAKQLKDSPRFHDFTRHDDACTMRDDRGGHLRIEPYRNFIIVVLGAEKDTRHIMSMQKKLIDDSSRERKSSN
jgi:hypothetical protein